MEHTTELALYSQTARLDHSRHALETNSYGTVTLCGEPFQVTSLLYPFGRTLWIRYNATKSLVKAASAWATPVSLAVTPGISVDFFSSR